MTLIGRSYMDDNDWDEKCPKCGESMFVAFMWLGYARRKCACERSNEQEEILRV